jgi:hypothetical protein
VSGRSDQTLSVGAGQTLTGDGTLNGDVSIGAGATLVPGTSIGALAFSANLVLNDGSTTVMAVNKSTNPSNDVAQVAGDLNYGGTLVITNLGTISFAAGDRFKLFNAAKYLGAFTNIVPAIPGINLAWDTSELSNGALSIVAEPTQPPEFGALKINGGNLIFSGSNGVPNWTYYLLATTNLKLPAASWVLLATNVFDEAGRFLFTNLADFDAPAQFYRLQLK